MERLELGLGLVVLVLEIYSVVNCILTPEHRVRGIPKALWIIVILVFPLIGSVLWIAVGRYAAPPRRAPDDDAAFLGTTDQLRLSRAARAEQDERIRRLEAELAALEKESDGDGDPDRRRDDSRG